MRFSNISLTSDLARSKILSLQIVDFLSLNSFIVEGSPLGNFGNLNHFCYLAEIGNSFHVLKNGRKRLKPSLTR